MVDRRQSGARVHQPELAVHLSGDDTGHKGHLGAANDRRDERVPDAGALSHAAVLARLFFVNDFVTNN